MSPTNERRVSRPVTITVAVRLDASAGVVMGRRRVAFGLDRIEGHRRVPDGDNGR
jgi:hypothetical protein